MDDGGSQPSEEGDEGVSGAARFDDPPAQKSESESSMETARRQGSRGSTLNAVQNSEARLSKSEPSLAVIVC